MRKVILLSLLFFNFVYIVNLYAKNIRPFTVGLLDKVLIVSNNALLFESPTVSSRVLKEIPILEYAILLSNRAVISDNKKLEWFFVGLYPTNLFSKESVKVRGWIERKYIAGFDDFEPAKKMKKEILLISEDADDSSYYRVYLNGTWGSFYEDTKTASYSQIYQCKLNENIYVLGLGSFAFLLEDEKVYAPFATKILTNSDDFPAWIKGRECPMNIGSYYTIAVDGVPVRKFPFHDKVLVKITKDTKVKLLEWSDEKATVGNVSGYWAYIDTGIKEKDGTTIKGWILDAYLKAILVRGYP